MYQFELFSWAFSRFCILYVTEHMQSGEAYGNRVS